jgi:hypothetical protein
MLAIASGLNLITKPATSSRTSNASPEPSWQRAIRAVAPVPDALPFERGDVA